MFIRKLARAGLADAGCCSGWQGLAVRARDGTAVGVMVGASLRGRIKVLAARRHKGYQTLLKEFVIERLYEEEKREGLVGR